MKIKAIITGATGMVGKGILLECLEDSKVESVLVVGRRSVGLEHAKLNEIIHKDFFDLSGIEDQLKGYNACFFSLGVSAVGKDEATYTKLTYHLTMHFAETVEKQNDDLKFIYVSGLGTDSTEKGRQMWGRVKGKTENALMKMKFKDVYAFRPGFIEPKKSIKSSTIGYNIGLFIIKPIIPLIHWLAPNQITTTTRIGRAAIVVALNGFREKHLYNRDLNELGKSN